MRREDGVSARMTQWGSVTCLQVCQDEAEMVGRLRVTLQDIMTDEITPDYSRITQMFLFQTL